MRVPLATLIAMVSTLSTVTAQSIAVTDLGPAVIVPHTGVLVPAGSEPGLALTDVRVGALIQGRIATTTVEVDIVNRGSQRRTAEVLLPVPEGAVVRGFDFQGAAAEPTAQLLEREVARRTFDEIVARIKDPALLEFVGYHLARSSVFPVEPGSEQRVRITYEHVLPQVGDRIDYELPRSEALLPVSTLHFTAKVVTEVPLAAVYSPTHELKQVPVSDREVSLRIEDDAEVDPGPVRISLVLRGGAAGATVFAHPDPVTDTTTFLAVVAVPEREVARPEVSREVTFVLDRSGSMKGGALQRVAQATLDAIGALRQDETFNVIAYNEYVRPFAEAPVARTDDEVSRVKAFLESLAPRGGTNIHDALLLALSQPDPGERRGMVLFLTDGVPTVGKTGEKDIRALASKANPSSRRVYTFGAGVDVNAPLLDALAESTGGFATWILPGEDPQRRIEAAFARLYDPTLADLTVTIEDDQRRDARHRVLDLCPTPIPDLYRGETLLLVGRLAGSDPVTLRIAGDHQGVRATCSVTVDPRAASVRDAFVPRLYAARRIAFLTEAIRDLGAVSDPDDHRLRELVDEVVQLSTEHGVLTEYTAFLALEGTDLTDRDDILEEAERAFRRRALAVRSGRGAVDQEVNLARLRSRHNARRRAALEVDGAVADPSAVRRVNDLTFYRRRGLWIDGRLVGTPALVRPRKVAFGSAEYRGVVRQLTDEGRTGCLALAGDVIVTIEGQAVRLARPEGIAAERRNS